jgi:hypothetical protein
MLPTQERCAQLARCGYTQTSAPQSEESYRVTGGAFSSNPKEFKVYSKVRVAFYLICRWAVDIHPPLAFNPLIKRILEENFQDWVEWKVAETMNSVDRQVSSIQEQWRAEENKEIVERTQEMFPDSKVVLHDEKTGTVFIEHAADGSQAQSILGGAMEIRTFPTITKFSEDSNDAEK